MRIWVLKHIVASSKSGKKGEAKKLKEEKKEEGGVKPPKPLGAYMFYT